MPCNYDLPNIVKEIEIGKTHIKFTNNAYVNKSEGDFDEVLKSIVKSAQQCCTAEIASAAAREEFDLPVP